MSDQTKVREQGVFEKKLCGCDKYFQGAWSLGQ